MRKVIPPLIGLLAIISEASFAHSLLVSSSPAAGATVSAPSDLKLAFSEGVESALTGANLRCANAVIAPVGEATFSPDRRALDYALPTLPKGTCRVQWHAVSVDGHRTRGEFDFTVR